MPLQLIMIKNIADGTKASEIDRIFRVILKIFAKTDNKIVDGPGRWGMGVSPSDFQDGFPGKWFPPVGDKQLKQLDLLVRQRDAAFLCISGVCCEIDSVLTESVDVRYLFGRVAGYP